MEFLTINSAYAITLIILLISTVVSRLELTKISSLYIDFIYPNINENHKEVKWKVLNYAILILSFLSGFAFFFNKIVLFKMFLVLTTISLIYSYIIRKIGKDGSDQVRVLAYISFTLCLLLDNEIAKLISVGFLGIQGLIAYTTSGLAKVLSKQWRKGNVLADILGTYSYGVPKVANFIKQYPFLEKTMSYSAIITMLAVPICFFIPYQEPLLIALICMFLFHFSTAILMGLNDFLFTFPLTYPGVLILHSSLFNY